ncbi:MAG TPA: penicillin acylase family protein [Deltaproteobacteria bacterium]|nr:penicillin acylase family protein [Deltaproteobacteria bacterium]
MERPSPCIHDLRHKAFFRSCALLLAASLLMGGCSSMASRHFRDTVDPAGGSVTLPGLKEDAAVRRDAYGIPFIDTKNMEDMAMVMGYVHASDRLAQMAGFRLMAQGRLAEMAGAPMLDLDIYMRTMGLERIAKTMLQGISPQNMALLERYCAGVNAYLEQHKDRLPPDLALAGYTPEPWRPLDTALVFCLVNLALSFNVYEETATLNVMQAVGPQKTAWLLPVYPDEPLPFAETAKLDGVDLLRASQALAGMGETQRLLGSLGLGGIAASNNWAIHKDRTAGSASILANDTHLLLSLPSMWNMLHIRCGSLDAAGISVAGAPAVVAGYNGHIAWGMTMVMADNQDLFLEQLKTIDGTVHYLYQGRWLPVAERRETFTIKGKDPVTVTVRETRHGPLLNDAVSNDPGHIFQPVSTETPYGVAVQWASLSEGDRTFDSFFALSSARSLDEAFPLMKDIRSIALNMVFADRDNIGWQVTGTYPVRARGRGLVPSPGWTGEYDWTGLLDPGVLPWSKNPPEGFIGTANNRTVGTDYPYILSSSWYWPERAERIAAMALATDRHTARTCMDMQLDTRSAFVPKMQAVFCTGAVSEAIGREIASWRDAKMQARARLGLSLLAGFDGDMAPGSGSAAFVGALLHCATRDIFLDELGPEGSKAWKSFLVINNESYNATCDHLTVRGDESPFWDDVRTPEKETKAQILALALADAVSFLESRLGSDAKAWTWGSLHTYHWQTEASKMAPRMGFIERTAMGLLEPYFNRGPYPASGDYFTLNVSGYMMGRDFDTWLIPAMRIVVDFSQEEPMFAVNSSGQSDNPSSPHYDDGIAAWRSGSYIPFPFGEEAIRERYTDVLHLRP